MQGQPLQIVVLSAIVTAALACAPDDQRPPSILQERASSVSLMVKSASSDAALASADVEIAERVICKRDPCSPVVTWKGRTDRRGVVRVPTSHLHDEMMLRVPGYGSREVAVSEFHPDNQAWTLYLAPDGPIACGTSADQWTIRVARDWRSAEVRDHDRAVEFGILRCSRDGGEFPGCVTPHVADAGYLASFSRDGQTLRVKIAAESMHGPRPFADLACREAR